MFEKDLMTIGEMRELHKTIWVKDAQHPCYVRSGGKLQSSTRYREQGFLLIPQVEIIRRSAIANQLVCVMGSSEFGFGYSMTLHQFLPVPGVALTDHVLTFTTRHLVAQGKSQTEEMFQLFSRFSHSTENRRFLRWANMPEPEPKAHYDY